MKRLMLTGLVAIAALGLVLSACDKKTDAPKDEPAKKEQPAKTEVKADAVKAADAKDPAKTVDLAKVMAKAGEGVDTSKAPEFMKATVKHMKAINDLTKSNMPDCKKVVAAVEKYMAANKTALETLGKDAEAAKENMKPEDQAKMGQQMMALMAPILQESMKVNMDFATKCQAEAKQLSEAMKALRMK